MGRLEFPFCIYREKDGTIREVPFPEGEPDPYDVPADLYCASYEVTKRLFGPPKLENLDITIFNTRAYRKDPEMEEQARDRLARAILAKEGAEIVQAAGGLTGLKAGIPVDTWWFEPDDPRAPKRLRKGQ